MIFSLSMPAVILSLFYLVIKNFDQETLAVYCI
ncbi:hypothetical protein EMIT0196MI5_140120 [Pseudomonas sp. IT-196MI5]